jgi:tRNA(Arg) A34 adenosine deaminase TadA
MSHEEYMRRANQLAVQAAKNGNHPFGAILVYNKEIIA